jgi:hypothetical protein
MPAKQFFLILDTETTVNDTVADFGAVIVDRKGNIQTQCAVLVKNHFDSFDLFYDPKDNGFWGKLAAVKRKESYIEMMNSGSRMLATTASINRWLEKAIGKYNPVLTAYNLPFDTSKCANTNIDLTGFSDRFCLWAAAVGNICKSKAYKAFALENHLFNAPTEKGNMTYKTNAEAVTGFLNGAFTLEPHTAIEDAIYFELPILKTILKRRIGKKKLSRTIGAIFR